MSEIVDDTMSLLAPDEETDPTCAAALRLLRHFAEAKETIDQIIPLDAKTFHGVGVDRRAEARNALEQEAAEG
jgi:hypothetical protein